MTPRAMRPGKRFSPSDRIRTFLVPELAEAGSRTGDSALLEFALEWLSERTRVISSGWATGIEARVRALASEGEVAESLYRQSIANSPVPVCDSSSPGLTFFTGSGCRRERRRLDARNHLRTALEAFTSMGAEAFARRAERELLPQASMPANGPVETRGDLTPQEAQIARLARDGLSNAEIGARLFISKHTVEYHLRKVFAKLGINSRTKLARALPPEPSSALLR